MVVVYFPNRHDEHVYNLKNKKFIVKHKIPLFFFFVKQSMGIKANEITNLCKISQIILKRVGTKL